MLHTVDTATSTNTLMGRMDAAGRLPHGFALLAREQTAGRGQRGNSWEAEPGMNVTMSVMLRPRGVEARRQFVVSEAVALAVADVAADILGPAHGAEVSVKWPNDIYVADRKLCGILIENTLSGSSIVRSIAGVGLNVNQCVFTSDAPNPVSLAQLTGLTYSVDAVAARVASRITQLLELDHALLHRDYAARLWRHSGVFGWRRASDGQTFRARIGAVAPDGALTLVHESDGHAEDFRFKEVAAVLSPSLIL